MARLKDRIQQFRNWQEKITTGKFDKQIEDQIKNRPVYNINQEVFDNQAMAKERAFGRDRAIQGQENNIEQNMANDIGTAKNFTNSASALLSTLSSLNQNKNQALRNLAIDEAGIQRDNMGALYNANQAIVDEKDKAWNYNINEPWQNRLAMLRDKKKARTENFWKILDTAGSIAGMAAGAPRMPKASSGSSYSGNGYTGSFDTNDYLNNYGYIG